MPLEFSLEDGSPTGLSLRCFRMNGRRAESQTGDAYEIGQDILLLRTIQKEIDEKQNHGNTSQRNNHPEPLS